MKNCLVFVVCGLICLTVRASWYWPFGDDDDDKVRLSELIEPASMLIEEASDLAAEGKVAESVEKYREALKELDRVEAENPDRIDKPEFATIKTKRAYVSATIDSLLLDQARSNARAVAVSDTTELEKRLERERRAKREEGRGKREEGGAKREEGRGRSEERGTKREERERRGESGVVRTGLTKREAAVKAITERDFATADALIAEMLSETPNGATPLNLRAMREVADGRYREAEATLDQSIKSNPRDYVSFYNMATLVLQTQSENKRRARYYYETGRTVGGPADAQLEELLK